MYKEGTTKCRGPMEENLSETPGTVGQHSTVLSPRVKRPGLTLRCTRWGPSGRLSLEPKLSTISWTRGGTGNEVKFGSRKDFVASRGKEHSSLIRLHMYVPLHVHRSKNSRSPTRQTSLLGPGPLGGPTTHPW